MASQREQVGIIRIALDSISPRWAGWALAAHASLTLGGSIWGVQHAIVTGGHETAYDFYIAVGIGIIWSFGMSLATVVTIAEVIDTIMVIAHFVGQKLRQEGVEEGLAKGREEGLAEGREEGLAAADARMQEWLARILEAHPELKDTIEPPPVHNGSRDAG